MKLNLPDENLPGGAKAGRGPGSKPPTTERTGIPGRVEAAAKMSVPPPKGKGLVMMLLGAAVLAALIWDFMGNSASSRNVRAAAKKRAEREAAAKADAEADPLLLPERGGEALEIKLGTGKPGQAPELALSSAAAVVYYTTAPAETQAELRPTFFAALAAVQDLTGRRGQEAYDLASRLLEGAGPECGEAIAELSLKALKALQDDTAAPAAILFASSLPDGVDKLTGYALDKVILDKARPLHIRVAAARARPAASRPAKVSALAKDAKTHPALRAVLQ